MREGSQLSDLTRATVLGLSGIGAELELRRYSLWGRELGNQNNGQTSTIDSYSADQRGGN